MWNLFLKKADTADKTLLTAEVLYDSVWKERNGTELKKCISSIVYALLGLMDVNGDGYLNEEEHRRFYHQVGVPDTSYAKETFNAIDVDHDGKLSFQEFAGAGYDFFFSTDEKSPYALVFGPLVD